MTRRSPGERRILFPWERKGGLRRRLGLYRLRPFLAATAGVAFLVLIWAREHERAGVRQTRATLVGMRARIDSYMADHDGGCPRALTDLAEYGVSPGAGVDAWQRPLRFRCTKGEGMAYELSSDGPDGKPGGLDRIE